MCMTSPHHDCTGDWLWLGKGNPVISLSKVALMAFREIRNHPSVKMTSAVCLCLTPSPDTPPSHLSRCSPTSALLLLTSPFGGVRKQEPNKEVDKPTYLPNQAAGTLGETLLSGVKVLTENSLLGDRKELAGGQQLILSLKRPQTHLL